MFLNVTSVLHNAKSMKPMFSVEIINLLSFKCFNLYWGTSRYFKLPII